MTNRGLCWGLGFKDALGGLLTSFKPTQTKLTPFFSNLLPEETMRHYLAERAGVNPAREFFLLWVLGAGSGWRDHGCACGW